MAPGVYDAITARLVERAGFSVAYMTGGGTSLSRGFPDIGLLSMAEMSEAARIVASSVSIPVIADADTGYGSAINVVRTLREFENAGVAAIQFEDQILPKRCGHLEGKQLVPLQEFCDKIRAAVSFKTDPDLVVVARTDACGVEGLDSAIERAQAYKSAGADVLFVEAPISEEQLVIIANSVRGPLLCNLVPGGKTPLLSPQQLGEMGYKIVIYPGVSLVGAIHGIEAALARVKAGTLGDTDDMGPHQLFEVVGNFRQWADVDERVLEGRVQK